MYEFTQDCLLHIDTIDEEHKRLFQMINESFALIETTPDVTPITENLVKTLRDYAVTHFAHEEAYMERIQDPELSLQKAEHAAFTQKINSFVPDTSSPEQTKKSLNDLLTYLVRWLYHHILSSDMMIGKMISATETTEDPFAFTDKYKTGIQAIDDEHSRLFEIIRETNNLIHKQFMHDKYDEILHLLAELKHYTEFHFQNEEALMERIHYPELSAQKHAHTIFIDRLVELNLSDLDEMDDHQQQYLLDLIQFLLGWLSNHILGSDQKIGDYIREQQIPEDSL